MFQDVSQLGLFSSLADMQRSNIRRRYLKPSRCRSSWCIRLLCFSLPLHTWRTSYHDPEVRNLHVHILLLINTFQRYLDVPLLISWLSSRQYAPEGGFSGRTNKLVDGCYSHWVGVCWPLLEACLDGPSVLDAKTGQLKPEKPHGSLYSREGLIRYILCCCQDQTRRGGLRDKPSQ